MSGTDKDARCWCEADGNNCPHCGARENAEQKSRCRRQALGVGPVRKARRHELLRGMRALGINYKEERANGPS